MLDVLWMHNLFGIKYKWTNILVSFSSLFCIVTVLYFALQIYLKILLPKKPNISGPCVKKYHPEGTDVAVVPMRKAALD
jgi:hypothetical protein